MRVSDGDIFPSVNRIQGGFLNNQEKGSLISMRSTKIAI